MNARIVKSITGREFRITSNKRKKTITIHEGSNKYRTYPMSKNDFEHARDYWTGNDFVQFLKTNEYYVVK